jgi:hypothetical protein
LIITIVSIFLFLFVGYDTCHLLNKTNTLFMSNCIALFFAYQQRDTHAIVYLDVRDSFTFYV